MYLLTNHEGKRVFCPFALFPLFCRRGGCSRAHLATVVLADTALGFGGPAVIADVFAAHHGLHAALHCLPIAVPGKGSTEGLHSHRNTASGVRNVSFTLWFAAIQPSSLQYIHGSSAQQRRPRSTNGLIRLRQKALVGELSPSQHQLHQAGLGDTVLATSSAIIPTTLSLTNAAEVLYCKAHAALRECTVTFRLTEKVGRDNMEKGESLGGLLGKG